MQTPAGSAVRVAELLSDRFKLHADNDVNNKQEEHRIDLHDYFVKSIRDQDTAIGEDNSLLPTIFQVPPEIRSTHEAAYAPMAVCIGPFFYSERDSIKLKQMQDYKRICAKKMMSNNTRSLQFCLEAMNNLEKDFRASYSGEIVMNSDELVEMMVLDGCFILHLLLKVNDDEAGTGTTDRVIDEYDMQIIGRCWIWNLVRYDLLLLENQIPFFVIVHLFVLHRNNYNLSQLEKLDELNEARKKLVACGVRLLKNIHPHGADDSFSVSDDQAVHHLLHLFYLSISSQCTTDRTPSPSSKQLEASPRWIPSAKVLQEAGIKFKRSKNGSRRFLDIEFSKGVMEIPPLEVHDFSNSLFRSLIAFEQCYPGTNYPVTIYVSFMNCLLNSPDDTRELYLSGILTNNLTTDQDAAHFFSRLCSQVHYTSETSYLRSLFVDVNTYQQSRRHKWWATLVREYCSNPWVITSFVAGVALLLLTAGQTFFTIYPYYHK